MLGPRRNLEVWGLFRCANITAEQKARAVFNGDIWFVANTGSSRERNKEKNEGQRDDGAFLVFAFVPRFRFLLLEPV